MTANKRTRRTSSPPANDAFMLNVEMPQDEDLEEVVVGALLMDSKAFGLVEGILRDSTFNSPKYKAMYLGIRELWKEKKKIDIITLTHQLRKMSLLDIAGGALGVTQVTNRVASSYNIDTHCKILVQLDMRRQMILGSMNIRNLALDMGNDEFDSVELINSLYKEVSSLTGATVESLESQIEQAVKHVEKETSDMHIQSPYDVINEFMGGHMLTSMQVIAARPGMGKTGFIVGIAKHTATVLSVPTMVFSLEMKATRLLFRMAAIDSNIDVSLILKNQLSNQQKNYLYAILNGWKNHPLHIIDHVRKLHEVCSTIRLYVQLYGVKQVIIDYLQIMDLDAFGFSREQQISHATRTLKGLANDLNINIILLSQLARSAEARKDSVPTLADLRESGAIEQDADDVIFLYRPEYYSKKLDQHGNDLTGKAYIIISKQRDGKIGNGWMRFIGPQTKFENINTATKLPDNSTSLFEGMPGPEQFEQPNF